MIRRRVIYRGNVQGVGFRFTTDRIARRYPVSGWVKNLSDGRVELLVEAESKSEVDAFLARVAEAFEENIESVDIREEPATGEFSGFGIGR